MLHSAIGICDDIDIPIGLAKVIAACQAGMGGVRPKAGILFTSCMDIDFHEVLAAINQAFPGIQLVGCTTDGEIGLGKDCIEDSLALLVLAGEGLKVAAAVACDLSRQPEEAFAAAVGEARAKLGGEPLFALTFPDGLSTIGIPLERVIRGAFGATFPVFGGTAGDHMQLTRTYQFCNDRVYSDAAPILLFAGDLRLDFAVRIGPVPTGPSYPVPRLERNVLYEIDGRPSLSFFQEYFGEIVEQSMHIPLAVYSEESRDYVLRNPISFNSADGSIAFVGNFPERCRVRLTMVSRENVLASAHQANQAVLHSAGESAELLLIFSCCSQRHVLGSKTAEQFALLKGGKRAVPYFGFYCYGEIAPLAEGAPTLYHSDTYIVLALSSTRP
jgi:hypothetical protein